MGYSEIDSPLSALFDKTLLDQRIQIRIQPAVPDVVPGITAIRWSYHLPPISHSNDFWLRYR